MQRNTDWLTTTPRAPTHRTVLCVDPDEASATMLHGAWWQLQFADELHIVRSQEDALAFLNSAQGKQGQAPLAAVVVDPEATGEKTGAFMRDVRKHAEPDAVPIVFWSRDSDKYKVLEGRGVEKVLKKPRVLRLVQALDGACQLRVQSFQPFAGNRSFVAPHPSQASE